MGYAACFESAVKTVSRRMKVDPGETAIDPKVFLVTGEDRSFNVAAQLDVSLPGLDDDKALASWCGPRTRCARTRTPREATSTSR